MTKTSNTTKKPTTKKSTKQKPAQPTDPDRFTPRQGKIVKISIVAALCLAILFLTGYPQYWFAYAKCGGAPVLVQSGNGIFAATADYYVLPGDDSFYTIRVSNTYYCTEAEAKNHADIYPHSNAAVQRSKSNRL